MKPSGPGRSPSLPLRHGRRADATGIPSAGPVLILATCPAGAMRPQEIEHTLKLQRTDLSIAWPPRQARAFAPLSLRTSARLLRRGRAVALIVASHRRRPDWSRFAGRALSRVGGLDVPIVPLDVRRAPHVEAGARIAASELMGLPAPAREPYLRLISDALRLHPRPCAAHRELMPLQAPRSREQLAAEIAALPADRTLVRRGPFQVCAVRPADAPELLAEITRLRELSFRRVGEGCGQPCDTDRFDAHYEHLFVWHAENHELVGAYRLACTDDVVRAHGIAGLYTSTLFDYDEALLRHTGSAIELGRSFVTPDWQRSFQPLLLLWAGIVTLLERRYPQVRCLFGPASISATYGSVARAVMARALLDQSAGTELEGLVRARHPASWPSGVGYPRHVAAALADPARLSQAIKHMAQGNGLPVLVRRYLELNGRFACFGIDDSFGGTLDGLVFVDVARIPATLLARLKGLGAGT